MGPGQDSLGEAHLAPFKQEHFSSSVVRKAGS